MAPMSVSFTWYDEICKSGALYGHPVDFFSCQGQAFQRAAQRCQAEADAEFLARLALEFYQGQVGLRLYPCQDALVGGVGVAVSARRRGVWRR